ncbi:MAG TPA: 50S ribosomal protein L29 [Candidatus Paceibacterota bacterium]
MSDEYQKKSDSELSKLLAEKKKEIQQFRFDISGSRIKNVKSGRNLRKDIARILTALKNKIKV